MLLHTGRIAAWQRRPRRGWVLNEDHVSAQGLIGFWATDPFVRDRGFRDATSFGAHLTELTSAGGGGTVVSDEVGLRWHGTDDAGTDGVSWKLTDLPAHLRIQPHLTGIGIMVTHRRLVAGASGYRIAGLLRTSANPRCSILYESSASNLWAYQSTATTDYGLGYTKNDDGPMAWPFLSAGSLEPDGTIHRWCGRLWQGPPSGTRADYAGSAPSSSTYDATSLFVAGTSTLTARHAIYDIRLYKQTVPTAQMEATAVDPWGLYYVLGTRTIFDLGAQAQKATVFSEQRVTAAPAVFTNESSRVWDGVIAPNFTGTFLQRSENSTDWTARLCPALLSVVAWIHPYTIDANPRRIYSAETPAGSLLHQLHLSNDEYLNYQQRYPTGGTDSHYWTSYPAVNQTSHVAIIHDRNATYPKAYVNGRDLGSPTSSGNNTYENVAGDNCLDVGNRAADGARTWHGRIWDFAIFNRLLTSSEVSALANRTKRPSDLDGATIYYPLTGPDWNRDRVKPSDTLTQLYGQAQVGEPVPRRQRKRRYFDLGEVTDAGAVFRESRAATRVEFKGESTAPLTTFHGIDRDSPQAQGLVCLFHGLPHGPDIEPVTQRPWVSNGGNTYKSIVTDGRQFGRAPTLTDNTGRYLLDNAFRDNEVNNPQAPVSMTAWVYYASLPTWVGMAILSVTTHDGYWAMTWAKEQQTSTVGSCTFAKRDSKIRITAANFLKTGWHHYAVTDTDSLSGSAIEMYCDGQLWTGGWDGTYNGAATGYYTLNGDAYAGSNHLSSAVRDIRVYDRTLTPAEVAEIYRNGDSLYQRPTRTYFDLGEITDVAMAPAIWTSKNRPGGNRPTFYGVNWDSPQATQLVAWFPMDVTRGVAYEAVSGTFATANGGVGSTRAVGTVGLGYDFDGTDDELVFTPPEGRGPATWQGQNLAVSAWVQPDVTNARDAIVTIGTSITSEGIQFNIGGNIQTGAIGIRRQTDTTVKYHTSDGYAMTIGACSHVGCSYNGGVGTSNKFTYVANGRQWTTYAGSSGTGTDVDHGRTITIGGNAFDTGWRYNGALMDVRIYHLADWSVPWRSEHYYSIYNPATRWDLYWQPGRRIYHDLGAAAPGLYRQGPRTYYYMGHVWSR